MCTLVVNAVMPRPAGRSHRSGWRGCSSSTFVPGARRVVTVWCSRREAAEDQLDDPVRERLVDRAARDQEPIEERSAEHVERELAVVVGAQVATLDSALEDGAQRGAAVGQEARADEAGQLGLTAHGVD